MKASILVPGRWHAFDLARELNRRGALDRLVTNYPKAKTRQWGIPDERVRSLFWHYFLMRGIWEAGGEGLDIRMGHFLFSLFGRASLRHLPPNGLLHAWAGAGLESLLASGRAHRTILIDRASAHRAEQDRILSGEYAKRGKPWPTRPQRMVERELREYELCDGVVVPSLFVERSFLNQRFSPTQLHRSCLGVDPASFAKTERPAPKKFQAIYVGSLSLRKGIPYLLEGFEQARIPGAELLVIGGQTQDWSDLSLHPPAGVRWLPHQPQATLSEHYRQASVFMMASLEEGQAMVQLQALACGLPLICTRHTGGEDLLEMSGAPQTCPGGISEFPAGYVVPAGDAQALAWCLQQLFRHPPLLEQKQDAARRIPVETFSWSAYAERNLSLYEKILSAKPGRRARQVVSA